MRNGKPIYIAGPMTGLPQFNIPAFHAMARKLRESGYAVISPVELDSEAIYNEAIKSPDGAMPAGGKIGGETWGEILARDVRVIADQVSAIVVLPGWFRSRGARLEVFVGLLCDLPVYIDVGAPNDPRVALSQITRGQAIQAIAGSFL